MSNRFLVMVCAALLMSGVLGSAPPAQAQGARPLTDVLEDWQGYNWSWIEARAGW